MRRIFLLAKAVFFKFSLLVRLSTLRTIVPKTIGIKSSDVLFSILFLELGSFIAKMLILDLSLFVSKLLTSDLNFFVAKLSVSVSLHS